MMNGLVVSRRLRYSRLALATLASATIAAWGSDVLVPPAGAEPCTSQGCGTNTPELYGTSIRGLYAGPPGDDTVTPSWEGVVVVPGKARAIARPKLDRIDPCAKVVNIKVVDGELVGLDADYNALACQG